MNAKQVLAVLAVALAGNVAMATEATQFEPPASTLTRAEVKADLARAVQDGTLVSRGEATQFADQTASVRSRADVRAEARLAARSVDFDELYAG
jgi:hypothetical protein